MELRRFIQSGIAASALAHLSVLATMLIFAEVHPFGSVTAEPIAVDIVSPAEAVPIPEKDEPPPKPDPQYNFDFSLKPTSSNPASSNPASSNPTSSNPTSSNPASSNPVAAPRAQQAPEPQSPPAVPPQKQAALTPPRPDRQAPGAPSQPQASPQQASPQQAQPQQAQPQQQQQTQSPPSSATPAFTPPQPDLSIKYHVMLGLPPELPPVQPEAKSTADAFDAPALKEADLAASFVNEFRKRLKTCSKLPPSIEPSDKLKIKLRVFMTPEGKLAVSPILIEASASAKGPLLMQSAIGALEACQPYAMLPADRYGEWKELDLSFTPQDF